MYLSSMEHLDLIQADMIVDLNIKSINAYGK